MAANHFCMFAPVRARNPGYIRGYRKALYSESLGISFIWSCFASCLLFLLFYVSLRNLCSGTCRKIRNPKHQEYHRSSNKMTDISREFIAGERGSGDLVPATPSPRERRLGSSLRYLDFVLTWLKRVLTFF